MEMFIYGVLVGANLMWLIHQILRRRELNEQKRYLREKRDGV